LSEKPDQSDSGSSVVVVMADEDLTELRAKTREVEEIGMKIDECLRMCQDNESLIQKLGRYDELTFNEAKYENLTVEAMREQILQFNAELE